MVASSETASDIWWNSAMVDGMKLKMTRRRLEGMMVMLTRLFGALDIFKCIGCWCGLAGRGFFSEVRRFLTTAKHSGVGERSFGAVRSCHALLCAFWPLFWTEFEELHPNVAIPANMKNALSIMIPLVSERNVIVTVLLVTWFTTITEQDGEDRSKVKREIHGLTWQLICPCDNRLNGIFLRLQASVLYLHFLKSIIVNLYSVT